MMLADAVDGGRNLGLEVGRQWDVSERLETLLPFGDGRLHECPHGLAHIGVGVLGADDLLAGQQDWVGAGPSGGVDLGEVEHQVVALVLLLHQLRTERDDIFACRRGLSDRGPRQGAGFAASFAKIGGNGLP